MTPAPDPTPDKENLLPSLAGVIAASPLQQKVITHSLRLARRNPWKTAAVLAVAGTALVWWKSHRVRTA